MESSLGFNPKGEGAEILVPVPKCAEIITETNRMLFIPICHAK
jgi:hypothetical protein